MKNEKPCHISETINFHQLAINGKLDTIDPKLLTQKSLTKQNDYKVNAIQLAARERNLHQIPQKILTQKNLEIPDNT